MTTTKEQDTLHFWHALEHLSPFNLDQTLNQAETEKRIRFSLPLDAQDCDLPWLDKGKCRTLGLDPAKNYSYRFYFGVFKAAEALNALRDLFGGGEPVVRYESKEHTCYGSIDVSGDGRLLPGTLALSTLPWAIGYLGEGSLEENLRVPDWAPRFRAYSGAIFSALAEKAADMERSGARVDSRILDSLVSWVVEMAGWHPGRREKLAECVLTEQRHQSVRPQGKQELQTPSDETAILNSFFIDELERVYEAYRQGDVGKALGEYLKMREPDARIDLNDRTQLKKWVAPGYIPFGRWASEDTKYQSLMQQAAINLIGSTIGDGAGLFSVNGPPGTGKTTMLRDIIADIVVRRAERLAEFTSPSGAFTFVEEVPVSHNRVVKLYRPDPRLTGCEIVVASSNNGAVQNVTDEIPAGKAIGEAYHEDASYFARVASYVISARKGELPPWGMVAAVLGKSANRSEFVQKFWFDIPTEDEPERFSFRHHLREVTTTQANWEKERGAFLRARNRVRQLVGEREAVARALDARDELAKFVAQAQQELNVAQEEAAAAEEAERLAGSALQEAKAELEEQRANVQSVALGKPSWIAFLLARIFAQPAVVSYEERMKAAQEELERTRMQVAGRKAARENAAKAYVARREASARAATALRSASEAFRENERRVEEGKRALGDAFAGDEWWARAEEEIQLRAPWVDEALNRARAELFVSAMRLHQIFIEVARSKVRSNLGLWVSALNGGLGNLEESSIRYLWQTFFLTVPVVSTTFASVGRMFNRLGRESLGWLLIDEAGQATPQMAVGALWRARRAVVVGDPLQIEPVFGVEESVVERIRQHRRAGAVWSPLVASAQTLADRVNLYGTHILTEDSELWVGCPLRVHRRCIEPMFGIANRIAYENKMVLATNTEPDGQIFPLGESRWIDVPGSCESGHWVAEQGEAVLIRLRAAAAVANAHERLFIISPFRDVANRLTRLAVERREEWWPGRHTLAEVKRWARRSIGTVHTFQGKEAEAVILVLGADEQTEGAARWAASRPNILNVAATRAQLRFYVIGSVGLWGKLNYFRTALLHLEVSSEEASAPPVNS